MQANPWPEPIDRHIKGYILKGKLWL